MAAIAESKLTLAGGADLPRLGNVNNVKRGAGFLRADRGATRIGQEPQKRRAAQRGGPSGITSEGCETGGGMSRRNVIFIHFAQGFRAPSIRSNPQFWDCLPLLTSRTMCSQRSHLP